EQREGDHGAGVGRDLRELRRGEQLMQRCADRQQKGVGLVAVEHPAEIRGDKRIPLPAIEAAIPRLRSSYASLGHRAPCLKPARIMAQIGVASSEGTNPVSATTVTDFRRATSPSMCASTR